ncbi:MULTISPECIES: DUF1828 domain-containing protein [unclassified Caballeronia]|uniref:DUF1828 domain-containing protein n=1 Tax=unclassified Caballeronia TaxID=2646786 RepID=UPI00285F78C1|nr:MULTISPECIES: DUF1828 domain-containing protein [unclassified Caballeronia]MDR5772690.1 DUF1828 domain-containing protein [Caballeronia sp. LZ002]MDR5848124.1 DUF1828 domain-containing protein [Caballeronia sp. LZ003]
MLRDAPDTVKRLLCESWCSELDVAQDGDALRLSMPLLEPDGDYVTVWLRQTMGGWLIEDAGTTLMRISYDSDATLLTRGPRRVLLDKMLAEYGARLGEDGQIVSESDETSLGMSLLRYDQALVRVNDLKTWNKSRVASTFSDDLKRHLIEIVGVDNVLENYLAPQVPDAADYPIDFSLRGGRAPLFVFGVATRERARLATIVLQHIDQHIESFDSIVVFQDASALPSGDLRRLMNAANDMVDSLDAKGALEKKIRHRLRTA